MDRRLNAYCNPACQQVQQNNYYTQIIKYAFTGRLCCVTGCATWHLRYLNFMLMYTLPEIFTSQARLFHDTL